MTAPRMSDVSRYISVQFRGTDKDVDAALDAMLRRAKKLKAFDGYLIEETELPAARLPHPDNN